MPEIIDIKDRPSEDKTVYYRYTIPQDTTPMNWFGHQEHGEVYRDFVICRSDTEHTFWNIKTKNLSDPVARLRGLFTTKQKAKDFIDQFYLEEQLAQQAANQKKTGKKDIIIG